MKRKLNKKLIWSSVIFTTIATLLTTTLYFGINYKKAVNQFYESNKKPFIRFDETNIVKNNILDTQNQADVNLYYSSFGVQTFYNLIRMAMLSEKEVHFYRSMDLKDYHTSLNVNKLEDFLKTKRKVSNQLFLTNSKVHELGRKTTEVEFLEQAIEYVKNNPNKKIAIWTNSDHFVRAAQLLARLSKFSNVLIFGIEDANSIANYILEKYYYDKQFIKNNQDNLGHWVNPIANFYINRGNQYLVSNFYPNISVWWSDSLNADKFQKMGIYKNYSFFENNSINLKDKIFNTRDNQNKRLSTYWASITGNDWERQRDIVKSIQDSNDKPSLLILGTESKNDQNLIAKILFEYGDEYNIYYKGHPGANINVSYVLNYLKPGYLVKYYDYETNQTNVFKVKNSWKITALENQIPSEELTSEHATEPNGLWFNKWIALDSTTSALFGILNNKNTYSDILMLAKSVNQQIYRKNSEEFDKLLTRIVSNGASKSIVITLKNQKQSSDFKLLDFDFSTLENSGFKIIKPLKLVQTTQDDDGNFFIEFELEISYQVNTEKPIDKFVVRILKNIKQNL
ncbi:hypothetical protein BCF59_0207 [Mycoplasmopsis mustelae]|uniref:Uncharacterized protein n=1 Tax=Mycoplasmopsis mustelae TaxID=171289 RepID=A0A4R7UF23_9BACT|nr:hypothetical protein [Mycoplasmopsis mustelae]TDV24254.1 hypothetical protein BCF59_0207 [Mycoplasmopsis mustelae]